MPVIKVSVKWQKELFKDIELNTDEAPLVFKAQLFALSMVQPERQKIMVKGKTIGDTDWSNVLPSLKENITMMMMGSVDKLLDAPVKATQFLEDLSEAQLAQALDLPVGLRNLGNTCYLNSVVQCLKGVPELCTSLSKFKNSSGDMQGSLTIALRDTYEHMDKFKQPDYPPLLLVQLLKTVFPQFSTMGENGVPQQQDANECLTELLRVLQQKLPQYEPEGQQTANPNAVIRGGMIDQYFSGEYECSMKCEESADEAVQKSTESFLQLSCFISQDVKYLQTGLKLRLEERLTKKSPMLGRDASYLKTSLIKRLPAYMCVNLVRFYYKEKERVSAKVLKDVKFPAMLDLFDLATPELQQRLVGNREAYRMQDEADAEARKAKKMAEKDDNKAKAIAMATGKEETKEAEKEMANFSFEQDAGSNNSGYYDLIGVLTHKGRSSNSGHYVGWSKNQQLNQWHMYDDDMVTKVEEEDILKLSGGGDWHTAYVLFYGPRRLEAKYVQLAKDKKIKEEEEAKKMVAETSPAATTESKK